MRSSCKQQFFGGHFFLLQSSHSSLGGFSLTTPKLVAAADRASSCIVPGESCSSVAAPAGLLASWTANIIITASWRAFPPISRAAESKSGLEESSVRQRQVNEIRRTPRGSLICRHADYENRHQPNCKTRRPKKRRLRPRSQTMIGTFALSFSSHRFCFCFCLCVRSRSRRDSFALSRVETSDQIKSYIDFCQRLPFVAG